MKKLFTLIIVAVAMMIATPANAQVKFGLKGGFNVSNMSLSQEVLETSNRMGFFVGPTVKVTLPLTGLSFDLSALYNQSDSKLADEKGVKEKTVSNKYVDIPLNARYGIGLGSFDVFAFAGPQVSFNVGHENINWGSSESYKTNFQMKKSLFSVNLGIGATISKIQLTANYNIPVGKTGELNVMDAASTIVKDGSTKVRNNTWQVGLAYFF
jgi:hypothetical protein